MVVSILTAGSILKDSFQQTTESQPHAKSRRHKDKWTGPSSSIHLLSNSRRISLKNTTETGWGGTCPQSTYSLPNNLSRIADTEHGQTCQNNTFKPYSPPTSFLFHPFQSRSHSISRVLHIPRLLFFWLSNNPFSICYPQQSLSLLGLHYLYLGHYPRIISINSFYIWFTVSSHSCHHHPKRT